MIRVALLCAVFVVAGSARAQDADEGPALRHYFSGNGLLNRGLYDLAAAEYRAFLEARPDHAKASVARYGLGVCLFRMERYRDAVAELRPLRDVDQFEYAAEVSMILGQSHLALDEPESAAALFGDVVADHPGHNLADEAAALQAEALYEAGRYDEVEAPARLIADRWPDSPHRDRAELFGGLAQMAQGRYEPAARRFERLTGDGPYADRASLLRAQSLHRAGNRPEAAAQYQRVISRAQREFAPEAMYGLAVLMHEDGRLTSAGRTLDDLMDRYPGHDVIEAAQLLRGRVWFDEGRYDQAVTLFEALASSTGEYRDDAVYWLAKCELRSGDPAGAAEQLAAALDRFPDSELVPQITYDRAVALVRAGRPDEALGILRSFHARFEGHALEPDAMHLTAAALHEVGAYGESRDVCRSFLGDYPAHELAPAVAFLEAENSYLLEEYAIAARAYRDLLAAYPDHPQTAQARYRQGLALHNLESYDMARPLLEGVVDGRDTDPEFRAALLALGDGHFQSGRWDDAEDALADYVSFGLDQPSADDALLKLGLARERQGELHSALTAFDRLIEEMPRSPHRLHAVFERGQVLAGLDRPGEAAEAFEHVLADDPDAPWAGHAERHLGVIALAAGDDVAAAGHFGRAAESYATKGQDEALVAEMMLQEGQALMSAQDFSGASDVFDRLAGLSLPAERRSETAALRAIALSRKDGRSHHREALEAIEDAESRYAKTLEPDLRTALGYEKAWCLREMGRPEDAAAAYRLALADDGSQRLQHHARLELAELEIEAERYAEAVELLERLRSDAQAGLGVPESIAGQGAYRLGVCRFHLGEYDDAADLLEQFLTGDPDPQLIAAASLLAGEARYRTGHHKRAVAHLRRVIDDYPGDEAHGPALLRLGECHAALQDWSQSQAAFEEYLAQYAGSDLWFQARFGVGWACENEGRYGEAITAYDDVVARHDGPTAARSQFQIGECLFAEKQYEEAVRALLKVDILYAYPEWSAAALYEAGRCFQAMGDPVDARAQYEQVRDLHAQSKWARLADDRLRELARPSVPGHQDSGASP